MTFGTRVPVTLAAFVTTVLLAACGGGESEMRATLADDDCTYEGDETPAAGMFTVEVENQTVYCGGLRAGRAIAECSTIDDLEPFLEKARQQFQRSGTLPDLPTYYEQVVRAGVEAGATSFLPADVPRRYVRPHVFRRGPPDLAGLCRRAAGRNRVARALYP